VIEAERKNNFGIFEMSRRTGIRRLDESRRWQTAKTVYPT
jgi:hypothetical protein